MTLPAGVWQVADAGRHLRALAARSPSPDLLPPVVWDNPHRAAFFFGEPVKMFEVIWDWFASGKIYQHLWVTLQETALAFVIGSVLGLVDRALARALADSPPRCSIPTSRR